MALVHAGDVHATVAPLAGALDRRIEGGSALRRLVERPVAPELPCR